MTSRILNALLGGIVAATVFVWPHDVSAQVDFETQIKPILEEHCIACHGPSREEVFRIDDYDDTMQFVEFEEAEESKLYTVLVETDEEQLMPPPNVGKPMTEASIELVKAWINEGAEWPDELESEWKDVPLPAADESDVPFRAVGSLHPAIVHLPIGLLLASGLFAFLSLRGNFVMSDCAYYCLWLGAIGSVFACASGWYFSEYHPHGYASVEEVADLLDQDSKMFWHRITGLGASAFAVILALFAASARNRDPDDGILWKLSVILLAGVIGFVGHEGGKLTYGKEHYKDLEKLVESFFPESAQDDGDRTVDDEADSAAEEKSETESEGPASLEA